MIFLRTRTPSDQNRLLNQKKTEKKFRQKIALLPFYEFLFFRLLQRNPGVLRV